MYFECGSFSIRSLVAMVIQFVRLNPTGRTLPEACHELMLVISWLRSMPDATHQSSIEYRFLGKAISHFVEGSSLKLDASCVHDTIRERDITAQPIIGTSSMLLLCNISYSV